MTNIYNKQLIYQRW